MFGVCFQIIQIVDTFCSISLIFLYESRITFHTDTHITHGISATSSRNIHILIDGIIDATGRADDNGYSITERLYAPGILQPERIFGLTQRFTRTFMAAGNCRFISLDKIDALALADSYEIFRLNMLNIICTKSQRLTRFPWRTQPKDIRHKIARFIETRCLRPAGEKIIHIKMERLSDEISESRLNVSRELNAMDDEGIISLRRGEIYVSALEKMIKN